MGTNPTSAIIAGVVIVLCIVWLVYYYTGKDGPAPTQAWYYDMGTGELYGAPGQGFPPKIAPSGKEAVKAKVFAERDCADPDDRFIVFLWKFTPEGQVTMYGSAGNMGLGIYTSATQMLVKTLDEDEWILRSPEERQELIAEATIEHGGELIKCLKFE